MSLEHFIVTGAGTGIGRAIAQRLALDGAAVSLMGRREALLEQTAATITGSCQLIPCDIRDAQSIETAFSQAVETFGPLRGLVANAGIGGPNEPGEQDRFFDLIQTNLVGTYQTIRATQSRLCVDGLCHVVVISSCLARFGVPGYSGYCASKAGLLGMVRALAHELAPRIQINAICPGWVDTEMARDGIQGMADAMGISYAQAHAQAMSVVPLGRMGQPKEIAGTVAWLLSPDAGGMTGQGIDINAGSWMG